jgi:hypothetical protein
VQRRIGSIEICSNELCAKEHCLSRAYIEVVQCGKSNGLGTLQVCAEMVFARGNVAPKMPDRLRLATHHHTNSDKETQAIGGLMFSEREP